MFFHFPLIHLNNVLFAYSFISLENDFLYLNLIIKPKINLNNVKVIIEFTLIEEIPKIINKDLVLKKTFLRLRKGVDIFYECWYS